MSLNVPLLRKSFEMVVERSPGLTGRFYEILFERRPEVRRLFGRNSSAAQERMLTDALVAVVDHLEDAPWLTQNLGALGTKHVGYGVTREMYDWVGDALIAALAEALGDDWNAEVHAAWAAAYGAIVDLMHPTDPIFDAPFVDSGTVIPSSGPTSRPLDSSRA